MKARNGLRSGGRVDAKRHPRERVAALVLALALLACHGAMGSLHLVPMETHAHNHGSVHGTHTSHADGESGGFLDAHHKADVEYFAVLSMLFIAALLFALRSKFGKPPAFVAARNMLPRSIPTLRLPRGPTLSSMQVFRL